MISNSLKIFIHKAILAEEKVPKKIQMNNLPINGIRASKNRCLLDHLMREESGFREAIVILKNNDSTLPLLQGNPKVDKIKHWPYSEGLMVGCRHFDIADVKPSFPFGHALSYTDFSIEKLESSRKKISQNDGLEINISIKNTGNRARSEVIQIYVRDVKSSLPRPNKELKGCRKVPLEAELIIKIRTSSKAR